MVFIKGPVAINLSEDTVFFDTVFTQLNGGNYPRSMTKKMMVSNPYKESIKLNVSVMGGSQSAYRINVDGQTGRVIREVEILPKDSAWVFIEASLTPNNQTLPALVRDSLLFEVNGNEQFVQLAAYGWDAYYLKDTVFNQTLSLNATDKPYVIVNTIFVDKNTTVSIGPGTHFYATPNAFIVSNNKKINIGSINVFGTLKINGTQANPVIFEGDRLDNAFQNTPGQWRGIHYWRGSVNNEITHAIIKNATVGLQIDSLPESGVYGLTVKQSTIKNCSAYGVLGLTAKTYFENTVISHCGANTFIGYIGGDYAFKHCSFYNPSNGRKDAQILFNNVLRDENNVAIRNYSLSIHLINSIIWGSLDNELSLDLNQAITLAEMDHCIYKSKSNYNAWGSNNLRNIDPMYKDVNLWDLSLKAGSPAINQADQTNSCSTDINDKTRDAQPDIGAFEF